MNYQRNEDVFQKVQDHPEPRENNSKKEGGISNQTRDKVEAAKAYIESR